MAIKDASGSSSWLQFSVDHWHCFYTKGKTRAHNHSCIRRVRTYHQMQIEEQETGLYSVSKCPTKHVNLSDLVKLLCKYTPFSLSKY